MQLKIVHVKLKENSECDFEIKHNVVVLVDRKVDTYESLKEMVMNEMFTKERPDSSLYRLRAYNVQFGILTETYSGKEDLTLEQLKIYPMKTLALEEKWSQDTPWTEYDPS